VSCPPAHFTPDAKLGRTIAKAEPGSANLNALLTELVAEVSDLFSRVFVHRRTVTREEVLALVRKLSKQAAPVTAAPLDPFDPTFVNYYAPWQQEHPDSTHDALRRYQ
jgi:hypothetical protein